MTLRGNAILLCLFTILVGCGDEPGASAPALEVGRPSAVSHIVFDDGTTIDASMSDAHFLMALGFDEPQKISDDKMIGIDGSTTTYTQGEKEAVITRSSVSGVFVTVTGRGLSGAWSLGAAGDRSAPNGQ